MRRNIVPSRHTVIPGLVVGMMGLLGLGLYAQNPENMISDSFARAGIATGDHASGSWAKAAPAQSQQVSTAATESEWLSKRVTYDGATPMDDGAISDMYWPETSSKPALKAGVINGTINIGDKLSVTRTMQRARSNAATFEVIAVEPIETVQLRETVTRLDNSVAAAPQLFIVTAKATAAGDSQVIRFAVEVPGGRQEVRKPIRINQAL